MCGTASAVDPIELMSEPRLSARNLHGMATPETLASDAERERVVDMLRGAAAEGRLTTEEFSERIDSAYAARTHGELEAVLHGLPRPAVQERRRTWRRLQHLALWFLPPNLICIAIWAATGAEPHFWPKWVLLGTGIRLLYGARGLVLGGPGPPPEPPRLPRPPGDPRRERGTARSGTTLRECSSGRRLASSRSFSERSMRPRWPLRAVTPAERA